MALTVTSEVRPSGRDRIRVVIAGDRLLVRAGLQALLEREPDIVVAGDAVDGDGATALARRLHPDVVLVTGALTGPEGERLTRDIVGDPALAVVRILFLTTSPTDEGVVRALRAGVSGFLLQDAGRDELAEAIRAIAAGDAVLAPSVARQLIDEVVAQPDLTRPSPVELDELTAREREVVSLVASGMSNAQIAEHLVVTPATAKTHVSRALSKLDARDRAQLVRLAYETGLVVARWNRAAPTEQRLAVAA